MHFSSFLKSLLLPKNVSDVRVRQNIQSILIKMKIKHFGRYTANFSRKRSVCCFQKHLVYSLKSLQTRHRFQREKHITCGSSRLQVFKKKQALKMQRDIFIFAEGSTCHQPATFKKLCYFADISKLCTHKCRLSFLQNNSHILLL